MKKTCIIVLFIITNQLLASTIPQYQVDSIDGQTVIFSNNAVLDVDFNHYFILQEWHQNDSIELVSMNEIIFYSSPIKIIDGRIVKSPLFLLRNLTKNNEQIVAWLHDAPTAPAPGTFLIASIDSVNRIITFNDSSTWTYPADEQLNINVWEIGDIIMVGLNGAFPPSQHDAILLNVNQQNIIRALQQ